MSPLIFGLVAAAAVMHGTWNALLKTAGDPLRTSSGSVVAGVVVGTPLAAIAWLAIGRPAIPPEAIGLALVSGLVEVVYFVFLSAAYRRGDLSLVYPIARGTAPLLAVASGVLVLGERLGTLGWLGVAGLLGGILMVRRPWRAVTARGRGRATGDAGPDSTTPPASEVHALRTRQAIGFALATGATIAVYSSIDRVGARLTEPWLYGIMLWIVCGAGLLGWVRLMDWRERRVAFAPGDPDAEVEAFDASARSAEFSSGVLSERGRAVVIGMLLLGAYLLILVAFASAPLTAVAPLRESAIVLASGWGAIRLGEAGGRREAALRIGGSALIVLGAVLLALEG